MKKSLLLLSFSFTLILLAFSQGQTRLNGFDLTHASIPINEIKHGGPPKDGIPSIDQPIFEKAHKATWLQANDDILGIVLNGIARAYPIRIMNWHEVVNDDIDGQAVVITFCPLCGSGISFAAEVDGQRHTFGVSGLLYNSDVLLYDRETESLWSQIMSEAVSGPKRGSKLTIIPTVYESWEQWCRRYPKTEVLSRQMGYARDYNRQPYQAYHLQEELMFPVADRSSLFPNKEKVLGISLNSKHKAYSFSELKKGKRKLVDHFAGEEVVITYDKWKHTAIMKDVEGNLLPAITLYWFAWYAFHPDTEVWRWEKD